MMENRFKNKHQSFIDVGMMKYSKPVFVIYNPASGRKMNFRDKIQDSLFAAGILYTI